MTTPITTTTGMVGGPLATDHQTGTSIRDWVIAHNDAVKLTAPTGDPLTTTWVSKNGNQSVTTTRDMGPPPESLEDMKARHVTDYMAQMVEEPPAI